MIDNVFEYIICNIYILFLSSFTRNESNLKLLDFLTDFAEIFKKMYYVKKDRRKAIHEF